MTTCRDIITLGLQLGRVVPLGDTPEAAEADTGLIVLQGMYDSMFTGGQFGRLTDVYATADYTAQENERIIADIATITIPDTFDDDGLRTPRDLSAVVIITDVTEFQYVFSGGRWEAAHALTLNSDAPLATRGKDGLALLFALYFKDAFGGDPLSARQIKRALQFQGSLNYKLGSTRDAKQATYY